MKRQTKIIITLLLSLTFLLAFATFTFALEADETEAEATLPYEKTDGANEENAEEENSEENSFTLLYEFLLDNADKIFSCLAFIGALILSFAYKKGLFPFVEKALSSLGASVKELREESEKHSSQNGEFINLLTEKLALSEKILASSEEKISELESKLSEATALGNKTEELRLVMTAEVEMIYNIFLSSSLPQYQKDKVGEVYSKMKEMLKEKEG